MSLSPDDARLLGASDFPALLGLSEWSGPVALWARMVHGFQGEGSEALSAGHHAENYIRALYQDRTGYALLGPSAWRHPLYPWLRCSPDDRAEAPGGRRLVELKRYNNPQGWGPEGTDVVPQHVWLQVQVQQGVGLDNGEVEEGAADVSALLRGELRLYTIQHVPEVYERCIAAGERFVRDFVQPARFPDGDNLVLLERDAQALRALFPAPKPDAEPMAWDALTSAQQGAVRGWLEAKSAAKQWKEREDALGLQLRALLRDAPGLLLPDDLGRRVDFKAQTGAARVDFKALRAALKDEDPEVARRMSALLEQFTTQEGTRPLVAR
jgi:hypothetical protein